MAIRFLNSGNISGNLEVNKSANAAVEIAKFKVTGTGGSFGAFSFVSILPGSGNFATQLRLHTNNTGNAFQSINNNAGVLELATNDSNPLVLKTNSTTRLTISNVGAATFTGLVSGITPTAAANFVTKAYADGLAPGSGVFLPLAGGTMSGNINMGDRKITNINEMSFGANAYITSPSNFLVRFNQTSVDVPSGDAIFGGTVIEDPNSLARKIEIAAADPVGLILNDTRDTHPITIANEGAVLNLKYNTTSMLSIDGATSNATFAGSIEFSGGVVRLSQNSLASGFNANSEDSDFWINYQGYQGGTTRYRDFRIGDGKQNQLAFFDGSTKNVTFAGTLQSGNFAIGVAPSSFGSGVPTITLQGTTANGRGGAIVFKEQDGTVTTNIYSTDGADGYGTVINAAQGSFRVSVGALAANKLEINSSGNVGIGITPFVSSLPNTVIDINPVASVWGFGNSAYLNANAYYNSGWLYKTTAAAGVLQVEGNLLRFRTAASGTAGAGITFDVPFLIDTTGNVGIGATSPVTKLHVESLGSGGNDGTCVYLHGDTPTNFPVMKIANATGGNATDTHGLLINNTAPGSGLRINNGGNTALIVKGDGKVGIGRSIPDYQLVISNNNAEGIELGPGYASGNNLWQNYNRTTGAYLIETHYASNYNFLTAGGNTGNVGIGTSSANEKLQVAGKTIINSTGNYTSNAGSLSVNSNSNANGGIVDTHSNGNHRYYTRVAHGNTGSSAAGYWHVKTNINVSASIMFLAKFYGFVYGQSAIVDLQHTGYAYTGGSVIAQGTTNNSSVGGMSSAIYLTAANEVCFRIDLGGSTYYAGLWMDVGFQNPTGGATNLLIQGTAWSTTANYYT